MKVVILLLTLAMLSSFVGQVNVVQASTTHASTTIYKWTDRDGNVHFGDRPDNIENATELKIKISNSTGVKNSSGNNKEREYLLKKIAEDEKADAEKRIKKVANDKKRRMLCNNYRSELQAYTQSNRVYKVAPDGERTYLTEQQRAVNTNKFKKAVAKYCQ